MALRMGWGILCLVCEGWWKVLSNVLLWMGNIGWKWLRSHFRNEKRGKRGNLGTVKDFLITLDFVSCGRFRIVSLSICVALHLTILEKDLGSFAKIGPDLAIVFLHPFLVCHLKCLPHVDCSTLSVQNCSGAPP